MSLPRAIEFEVTYRRKGQMIIDSADELDDLLEGKQITVRSQNGGLLRAVMTRAEFVLIEHDE